jgi:hypothetical protein
MTKEEYNEIYTYGLDGQEPMPFAKFALLLADLAERGCGAKVALAANTVGLALIGAGDGYVVITDTNGATDIVHLPAVADIEVGHVVRGTIAATGCKIRVAVADDTTVYMNGDNTTHRAITLVAGAQFEAILIDATHWIVKHYSNAGAFTAPTPA